MASETQFQDWTTSAGTVLDLFARAARAHPQRLYTSNEAGTLTYGQASAAISALAGELGPGAKGRTIAIVLPNSPAFLVAYFAVLAAGARPALVNNGHPEATIGKLTNGLDLAATLSDRQISGLDVTHLDDARIIALANGDTGADLPSGMPEDIAAILFSGGTTGLPKQVPHSNRALICKVERMEWGWPTHDGERWLPVAPFTHVYGFLMGVLNPVLRAGSLFIPPRFHPDLIAQALADQKITIFGGGPPAIYQAIMASEIFANTSYPDLRVCPGGGAPFPLDVHRRWQEATGLPITEGYGMTEIAPITVNTASAGMRLGSAGKAVPDTQIQIVDIATGKEILGPAMTGEIRVKGPHLMKGYVGNPEETAIALKDGFLYTGDIGQVDEDGFLIISDRKKDVIFVKGFNVFPREVEEVLLSHPQIAGACVVGRPDERAGELPVAFITLRSNVDPATIERFCADHLTDYKCPSGIVTLDALPLTPAGKVDRTALRARAHNGA